MFVIRLLAEVLSFIDPDCGGVGDCCPPLIEEVVAGGLVLKRSAESFSKFSDEKVMLLFRPVMMSIVDWLSLVCSRCRPEKPLF